MCACSQDQFALQKLSTSRNIFFPIAVSMSQVNRRHSLVLTRHIHTNGGFRTEVCNTGVIHGPPCPKEKAKLSMDRCSWEQGPKSPCTNYWKTMENHESGWHWMHLLHYCNKVAKQWTEHCHHCKDRTSPIVNKYWHKTGSFLHLEAVKISIPMLDTNPMLNKAKKVSIKIDGEALHIPKSLCCSYSPFCYLFFMNNDASCRQQQQQHNSKCGVWLHTYLCK